MKSPRQPRAGLSEVRLWWYAVGLLPIAALLGLSFLGFLPVLFFAFAFFLFCFWIFSFGFAIYAKLRKPKDLRQ